MGCFKKTAQMTKDFKFSLEQYQALSLGRRVTHRLLFFTNPLFLLHLCLDQYGGFLLGVHGGNGMQELLQH